MTSVLFWETLKSGGIIPVCQARNSEYVQSRGKKEDFSHQYVNICLTDNPPHAQDARMCRKLFKKGYRCEVWRRHCDSAEADLLTFFYYELVMTYPKDLTTQTFYFKRNKIAHKLTDSCYASDDHGIVLLKLFGRKLRCCYVDLKSCVPKFGSIPFLPIKCAVYVYKKTVWVLERNPYEVCEFHWMNFDTDGKQPVYKKIYFEILAFTDDQNFSQHLSYNENSLMLSRYKTYIWYDSHSKHGLTTQRIPSDLYKSSKANMICDDVCLFQVSRDDVYPPKIYVTSVTPDIIVKKVINFDDVFNSCTQYFPYGFELSVYPTAMKALVQTGESYVVVIDLSKLSVSQILTYIDCFWQHKLTLMFSQDGQELRFIGRCDDMRSISSTMNYDSTRNSGNYKKVSYLVAQFGMWYGMSLQDICKHFLKRNVMLRDLDTEVIPRYLMKELEEYYA